MSLDKLALKVPSSQDTGSSVDPNPSTETSGKIPSRSFDLSAGMTERQLVAQTGHTGYSQRVHKIL